MFDVEKLAWVNRHYLKAAAPERLARLSLPYLQAGRVGSRAVGMPTSRSSSAIVPVAAASVDRLEQVPARLAFLFDYSATRALEDPADACRSRWRREAVIDALAEELERSDRCSTSEAFRAAATRVRERTGQKGKALFHPIRLALTGETEGLELDLAVPAIERGRIARRRRAFERILGARRTRCREFASALDTVSMIVYGINPVLEALRAGRVKAVADRAARDDRMRELLAFAATHGITSATRRRLTCSSRRRAAACIRASLPTSTTPRSTAVEDLVRGASGRR